MFNVCWTWSFDVGHATLFIRPGKNFRNSDEENCDLNGCDVMWETVQNSLADHGSENRANLFNTAFGRRCTVGDA